MLPTQLLPGLGWSDVVGAIEHEEGSGMRRPLPSVEARLTRPVTRFERYIMERCIVTSYALMRRPGT